ncbi:MAG: hypothetical protein KAS57_04620 [Gammaproteobacteria bacterium]|nr:hypothetical protein [Gammaproteobacteria bacterium]
MKNSITISAEFYFKGEKLSPSMVIDLDAHIEKQQTVESFLPLLARNNNMDLFSYEYEMLQAEELVFTDAQGLAKAFLNDGYFDFEGFEQAWREERIAESVAKIAKEHLDVDELSLQPELKAALTEAFKLGQQS